MMWFVALVVWAGLLSFVWLLLRTLGVDLAEAPTDASEGGHKILGNGN